MAKIYTLVYTSIYSDDIDRASSEVVGTFRNYSDAVKARTEFIQSREINHDGDVEIESDDNLLELVYTNGDWARHLLEIFETVIQ